MSVLDVLEGRQPYSLDCADALEWLRGVPDGCASMIACDLPYGTTACEWDSIIPLEPLWEQYKRIIKSRGAIVLTASQPFTSALVMSNPKWFKYEIVWNKKLSSGALNADVMPLKIHENVLVFGKGRTTFNKQFKRGMSRVNTPSYIPNGDIRQDKSVVLRGYENTDGLYNPVSILEISNANRVGIVHPTQKPVALFEYLIRTYSNEGNIILDCCFGSGTTAVAAAKCGRRFIGCEKEAKYFTPAVERVTAAYAGGYQLLLEVAA